LSGSKEEEINRFLKEFKMVAKQRGIDFVPRQEFIETLILFGITRRNCEEEILSLSVDDYCQGPDDDRDRPGKVWIFGRHIEDREVYIKLKLATVGKEMIAKCLSFHPAGFPLCFPLRLRKGGKEK
jgi:hypothetical protein